MTKILRLDVENWVTFALLLTWYWWWIHSIWIQASVTRSMHRFTSCKWHDTFKIQSNYPPEESVWNFCIAYIIDAAGSFTFLKEILVLDFLLHHIWHTTLGSQTKIKDVTQKSACLKWDGACAPTKSRNHFGPKKTSFRSICETISKFVNKYSWWRWLVLFNLF